MPELTSVRARSVVRRVAHLDDALEPAVAAPDDAPEVGADGVGPLEGQDGGGGAGLGVRRPQRLEAGRVGQRMVGVEHEHVAVEALERSARRSDGVAGPERLLLGRPARPRRAGARGSPRRRGARQRASGPGPTRRRRRPPSRSASVRGSRAAPSASWIACGCPDRRRGEHRRVESRESCGGVGGRCWELGRLDSNQGSRDQNPLPYHLATPHRARSLGAHRVYVRRGSGRLRTEAGTARRTPGTLRGGRSRCGTRPRAP